MSKKLIRFQLLIALAILSSACATTWAERAPTWQPKEPVPALLVHYKVKAPAKGLSIMGAINAAQGADPLAQIGQETLPVLKAGLSEMNLALYTDATRTSKMDEANTLVKLEINDTVKAAGNILANMANATDGTWWAPNTSKQPFHLKGTFLKGKFFKRIAETVGGENPKEVFVSAEVRLTSESSWMVLTKCKLKLMLRAINNEGKPVYQAQAEGFGDSAFFGNGINETTVRQALTEALGKLGKAEIGEI